MREFVFNKTESPSMENFNKRFSDLQNFANFLGNEYVWKKTRYGTTLGAEFSDNADGFYNISYGDSVSVVDGAIVINNPIVVSGYWPDLSTAPGKLKGKYCNLGIYSNNRICYVKTMTYSNSRAVFTAAYVEAVADYTSYVNSPDPNAYPVDDGYTYTALGMLGEKVKVVMGSYAGANSHKKTINVGFKPKILFIGTGGGGVFPLPNWTGWTDGSAIIMGWQTSIGIGVDASTEYRLDLAFSDTGITMTSAAGANTNGYKCAFNLSGRTYDYLAIG